MLTEIKPSGIEQQKTERARKKPTLKKYGYHWFVIATVDLLVYIFVALFCFVLYPMHVDSLTPGLVAAHIVIGFACLLTARLAGRIYGMIWRYAGPLEYTRLILTDATATLAFVILRLLLPVHSTLVRTVSLFSLNLLVDIMLRQIYQWIFQNRGSDNWLIRTVLSVFKAVAGVSFTKPERADNRIRIAIVGAGSVGVMLADELIKNPKATYTPVCFVDIDKEKVGRAIFGIDILSGADDLHEKLIARGVQEVVFALPNTSWERRAELYKRYETYGYKIKAYDYPTLNETGRRSIRDFDVEDLLFRSATKFLDEKVMSWYRGKKVLITGGGGSIGSELARQIAKCEPARLVLLDVYENGVYNIQQELRGQYGDKLNLRVEIATVCDPDKIDKIIQENTPDIVLHAAAHKHVPLMERNACEAVSNNVFGTLNVVQACEKYGVKRFIMVSTDKAVNPTNVMGATKRMCEMIIQSWGAEPPEGSQTTFSATRFGNVLGSNGSVIPLFKRQIANGGPVTITDKRIIRYFMTIPEASQLVMASGAMAENGELYVLDMGKPVRILNLAESMIRLSGLQPYIDIDIVETGLRPGEKLYEELLIKTEELDKTDNNMIFVERDKPFSRKEIEEKLDVLREALATQSNHVVREALMQVVPTYHTPEEVNRRAIETEEMRIAGVTGGAAVYQPPRDQRYGVR